MKKLLPFAAGIIAVLLSTTSALAVTETGAANLHPIGQSGIHGEMQYVDDQTAKVLTVTGTATGLDPTKNYVSLFYDVGSKPSGPVACEPSIGPGQPGFLNFPQMLIGFWTVNSDGTGTLSVTKTGMSYVSLDAVHTQSIRLFTPPAVPVRACGEVHHSEGRG